MHRPLAVAAPLTRTSLVASALSALLYFGVSVHQTFSDRDPMTISVAAMLFLGAQLVSAFALMAFVRRASSCLERDRARTRAPSRWKALWLSVPVVGHLAAWSHLHGLLEDSRDLVRGGGDDGRLNLALFVVCRGLSSILVYTLLLVGGAALIPFVPFEATHLAIAFFVAAPAFAAAWSGALFLRRVEMRFADAHAQDAKSFAPLLSHAY